ncbi:hypothetical protein PAAG_01628 [Paracoccidioides lutzii Pb01]|uniref:Uncharacterized protein n=1 Tax=Paracoccidioides lutzii (strain ATCC MYA-826 / Pb01) TaxID=502779 RepID=C1GSY3_PARBA|nr:hypothetical protein PAAG_01628 [Paracoccidioides lutzii Pb01]EEH39166.2 hypothetical protein PAAG_01628 [Paracoccidioides lutzii Pb01]
MLFPYAKLLTLALAFISATSAIPVENQEPENQRLETGAKKRQSEKMIIGYMTVSKSRARDYNKHGTITWDEKHDRKSDDRQQTGPGIYTTPVRGQQEGDKNSWYCVIEADRAAMKRVSKIWVPRENNQRHLQSLITYNPTLWWRSEGILHNYITWMDGSWNSEKTLRMSIVYKHPEQVQMSIPENLVNAKNGHMGFTALCDTDQKNLPDEKVNYDDWHENILGSRT